VGVLVDVDVCVVGAVVEASEAVPPEIVEVVAVEEMSVPAAGPEVGAGEVDAVVAFVLAGCDGVSSVATLAESSERVAPPPPPVV
jgi:hypothetical protein